MFQNRGYALIETLLASVILATGLISVASLFSASTGFNVRNRQRTLASLLLYDKMEQLQAMSTPVGGGLDPMHPVVGFMEYVTVANDGTMTVDNLNSLAPYMILWQVEAAESKTATIEVFGRIASTAPLELARATGSW